MANFISLGEGFGEEIINFGKFKGMTIDEIASTDEGLLYLDWLSDQNWLRAATKSAILGYLSVESIKRELEKLVD